MFQVSSIRRSIYLASILCSAMVLPTFAAEPKLLNAKHEEAVHDVPGKATESDRTTSQQRPIAQQNDVSDEASEPVEAQPAYSPEWPAPPNAGALLLRLFVGAFTIVAVGLGMVWFGKPWLQRLKVVSPTNPNLQIEGSLAIGHRAMLYLVRAGDTQLVAGIDATGLKSLIALPASFKDVLDSRVSDTEEPVQAPLPTVIPASNFRFSAKE